MSTATKVILAAVCSVVLLVGGAVAYYFVVALPAENRAQLEFERQQYAEAQNAKAAEAAKEADEVKQQTVQWLLCRAGADDRYNQDLKLNGTPVYGHPGEFSVSTDEHDLLARSYQEDKNQCDTRFPKADKMALTSLGSSTHAQPASLPTQ